MTYFSIHWGAQQVALPPSELYFFLCKFQDDTFGTLPNYMWYMVIMINIYLVYGILIRPSILYKDSTC